MLVLLKMKQVVLQLHVKESRHFLKKISSMLVMFLILLKREMKRQRQLFLKWKKILDRCSQQSVLSVIQKCL